MLAQKPSNYKLKIHQLDQLVFALEDSIHSEYKHRLRTLALKILSDYVKVCGPGYSWGASTYRHVKVPQ